MEIQIKNINQSLNKGYLAKSPYINQIELFRRNYATFIKSINPVESEETLKDYINRFLNNAYNSTKYTTKVNENNIDLVIKNGINADDKIAVIIEVKAIKNTSEMISTTDINRKAFHEALLYYMEQRVKGKNAEIKHIIITNGIEWFFFDANEFERIFYSDNVFFKSYVKWSEGKLVSKNKDWFYTELAKPFVEKLEETIEGTYFKLSENFELSESSSIELYKIFSPEHLLKLSFINDSNTLNIQFYNELLHILGLHETKQNKIKTIERLPKNKQQKGSLLENTISMLQTNDVLYRIESPGRFGETKEEQLFSIALELCIIWLNRILFLKLLESQLIKYHKRVQPIHNSQLSDSYRFLYTDKIQDFEQLNELFFEVLAVKPQLRTKFLQEKYANIPYLNSSLFEPSQIEREALYINQLKSHSELQIYSSTVLKDKNGNTISGSRAVLSYIFDFLDSYNFASDHKVEIQQTPKSIINSAVLGLIFEKINGYKEGSHFTPGFITMYMCRETLRKAVVHKFRNSNLEGFQNIEGFTELYNKIGDISIEEANQIINSLKICDPSVGSGHFLVSALNELIAIKSDLDILADENGRLLRNVNVDVVNDELFVTIDSEPFSYNFKNNESRRIQKSLFREKQTLIENCLFGVDINPKSVNISRLRLWIELLKNAYYNVQIKNGVIVEKGELQTLPNIDINIKTGNSLISHFALNGNGNGNGNAKSLKVYTQKYKQVVSDYKNANDREAKKTIERFIREQKENFSRTVNPGDEDVQKIRKIETDINTMPMFFSRDDQIQWQKKVEHLQKELKQLQEKYEDKLKTLYNQAFEWRFEFPEVLDNNGKFVGFDVIIGNPPYISAVDMARTNIQKDYFKINYPEATGAYDIFILFLKKATNLLRNNGVYSWIIPNKFLAAQYAEKTKELLLNKGLNASIDISHIKVFSKASVYPIIIFGQNGDEKTNFKKYKVETAEDLSENNIVEYSQLPYFKSFKQVGIKIKSGTTGFEAQKIKQLITKSKSKNSIPFIVSGSIDRYCISYSNVRFMGTVFSKAFIENNQKIADSKWNFWNKPKIVIAGMTKIIEAIYADKPLAIGVGTYGIYEFGGFDPLFLLGVLNSKFMGHYVTNKFRDKHLAGGYLSINKNMIEKFPIVDVNKTTQKTIVKLVRKIQKINAKAPKSDTTEIEKQIDAEVYNLYGITDDEIIAIENETV